MKRYSIFAIISTLTLLFTSCEQEPQPTWPDGELPIFNGYMQFSTEVSTRSDLATNMRGRNFGVLGYSYSYTSNWDTAKKLATPDIFYNQMVRCSENGICSYDIDNEEGGNQLEPWNATKWYTFFAYSPYNGGGITLSERNVVNTPYLTYNYAWLNDALLYGEITAHGNNQMFDLMTAEHIDADGSTNVGLNFKHRLFAIEVLANNYNESAFEMEQKIDENGDPVVDNAGKPVMVVKRDSDGKPILLLDGEGKPVNDQSKKISGMTLTIKGLTHSSMTIPISMRSGEKEIEYTSSDQLKNKAVKFNIQNQEVTIPAFNDPQPDGRGEGVATSISKFGCDNNDGYLMFIPQKNAELFFTVDWPDSDPDSSKNYEETISSSINFEAGKLYQIIINFVGSGITIALIEAGAWDYQTVIHRFE